LNRVDDEKTRNKALVPNYADIRSGKALSVDFQLPLAFSSLLREDYILTPRVPSRRTLSRGSLMQRLRSLIHQLAQVNTTKNMHTVNLILTRS
jgi:hypothetical protein